VDFEQIVFRDFLAIPRFVPPSPLSEGTFYWRVRVVEGKTLGTWSESFSFTVGLSSRGK
jgi:hypothetical protein